jgi:hypothetical protein
MKQLFEKSPPLIEGPSTNKLLKAKVHSNHKKQQMQVHKFISPSY